MKRIRVLLLALILAAGSAPALAQENPAISQWRQDRAREESREGQRIDGREVHRRATAGRPGRMLTRSESGGGGRVIHVVGWEYPGGRKAGIRVDGRAGPSTRGL